MAKARLRPFEKTDLTLLAVGTVSVLSAVDVVQDYRNGATAAHIAGEAVVMLLALGGALALWAQRQAARLEVRLLGQDLVKAQAQARQWQEETRLALHGLGEAVVRQFDRWGLSAAEREVAVLLLKGLRHKEIAGLRGTSERTVRQQAFTVYRKAGLTSRTELAAFFLDAALLPALEATKEREAISA